MILLSWFDFMFEEYSEIALEYTVGAVYFSFHGKILCSKSRILVAISFHSPHPSITILVHHLFYSDTSFPNFVFFVFLWYIEDYDKWKPIKKEETKSKQYCPRHLTFLCLHKSELPLAITYYLIPEKKGVPTMKKVYYAMLWWPYPFILRVWNIILEAFFLLRNVCTWCETKK